MKWLKAELYLLDKYTVKLIITLGKNRESYLKMVISRILSSILFIEKPGARRFIISMLFITGL